MSGVGVRVRTATQTHETAQVARLPLHVRLDWALPVAIAAATLGVDVYRLGDPALWFDETFSMHVARLPAPAMWVAVLRGEPNMNLYFLALSGWTQLLTALGLTVTEFWARLPSVVFAVLSAVMVYLLGRRLIGMTAGALAAGLYLLNNAQLSAAQTARAYTLLLLLICVSWYAWLALLSKDASRWWWVVYVTAGALSVWAHLLGGLILLAQAGAFAGIVLIPGPWRETARTRVVSMLGSLAVIGALVAPHLYLATHHAPQTSWVPVPRPRDIVHVYVVFLGNSSPGSFWLVTALGLAALVGLALARVPDVARLCGRVAGGAAALESDPAVRVRFATGAGMLLCWLVVPMLAAYLASQHSLEIFLVRYMVIVLPALCLLLGMGTALVRWTPLRAIVATVLIGASLIAIPQYYVHAQIQDFRTPARWLVKHYQPGDGLVCHFRDVHPGCFDFEFEYYLYYFHADSLAKEIGPRSPGSQAWADLAAYAAQHSRLAFVTGDFGRPADAAEAQVTQTWLDSHYLLVSAFSAPGGGVRIYATGAAGVQRAALWSGGAERDAARGTRY